MLRSVKLCLFDYPPFDQGLETLHEDGEPSPDRIRQHRLHNPRAIINVGGKKHEVRKMIIVINMIIMIIIMMNMMIITMKIMLLLMITIITVVILMVVMMMKMKTKMTRMFNKF